MKFDSKLLNNNIILVPLSMLILNLSGVLLKEKIPRALFEFLALPIFEPLIFGFLFYVASRNFVVSFTMGFVFWIMLFVFFSEHSPMYILPKIRNIEILEKPIDTNQNELDTKNRMLYNLHKKSEEINSYRKILKNIRNNIL
jgi:hypothetical protein